MKTLLCIATLWTAVVANVAIAQDKRIDLRVNDARPVGAAVKLLTDQHPIVITYEDPQFEFSGDLKNGQSRNFFVPRGGTLGFAHVVSRDTGLPTDLLGELQALVDGERGRGGWRFRVERSGDFYHVIPVEARDSTGRFVSKGSILDTLVTLDTGTMSGAQLIDAVCKQLTSNLGIPVVLGVVPVNALNRFSGTVVANNRRARDVLQDLLHQIDSRLTWQLLYGVSPYKLYAMNIGLTAAPPEPDVDISALVPSIGPSDVPPTGRRKLALGPSSLPASP
jgi:hypothetical protein